MILKNKNMVAVEDWNRMPGVMRWITDCGNGFATNYKQGYYDRRKATPERLLYLKVIVSTESETT
jgi:hypothetical protein